MAQEALAALEELKLKFHKDEQGRITGGTMHIQHSLYPGLPKDGTRTRPLYLGETKTQKGNPYKSTNSFQLLRAGTQKTRHSKITCKGSTQNTGGAFR